MLLVLTSTLKVKAKNDTRLERPWKTNRLQISPDFIVQLILQISLLNDAQVNLSLQISATQQEQHYNQQQQQQQQQQNNNNNNNNNNRSSVETLPPVEKSQLSKPLLNRRKTSLRACNSPF
ncbi:hypothetical protein T4B_69 [Trichinella pseudospiralis]|uniref:Uncharacterized protein n=1 Tax=Trichinella pseudospiralis TaxID=6337 RepID=A0A0V1IIU1_TRIPS|nr:hypothetical protein T4B_69 [Trichinella pseudospiralis]